MERVAAFVMKYGWAWILAAVLVIGAGGYYFVLQGSRSKAAPDFLIHVEELTPEEKLRLEIDRSVSGLGGELKQAVPTDAGWVVGAEFTESDVNLEMALETAQNVFSELARIDITLDEAVIVFRSDGLRDVYGHQLKDVVIARIGLDGSTMERVNWQGFEFLNFPRITDDFWLHDEMQKQWAELEKKLAEEGQSSPADQESGGSGNSGQGGGSGNMSSGGGSS